MQRLSDALDRLRYFPTVVADVATLRGEMDLFLADAPNATMVKEWPGAGLPDGAFRPLSLMPILRGAPIVLGLAVGWHRLSPSLAERGGTIVAGREALKHGVPTWALGYADPPATAAGNHVLIEQGASPIPVSAEWEVAIPPELYARDGWIVEVVGEPERIRTYT